PVSTDSFVLSGTIGGTGGLTMVGANGNLVLTGNNTYSGTTTINAGFLTVTGSQPNSPIVINAGALFGTGIVGSTTVNSGFISPGISLGSTGILTTGNLRFNGGVLRILGNSAVPGTGFSQLVVNGSVNLGAGVANLEDDTTLRFDYGTKFRIIDNDGA